ncbi:MAG: GHMP family kinase ATP-binding protein [Promethearchaeota archaeon]
MSGNHKKVEVKVPLRISGFFQMMDPSMPKPEDPTHIGSRGGGPALTAYGMTTITKMIPNKRNNKNIQAEIKIDTQTDVELNQIGDSEADVGEKSEQSISYEIYINGENCTKSAKTSLATLNLMREILPQNIHIKIEHRFDLLMGAGFGSSSAGAMGIALGLNSLFNLGLTKLQASKFAHIADVQSHTGLGTVGGQFVGGLSISLEPGYPFQMHKIPIKPGIKIVVGSFGAISTKSILTDPVYRLLIFEKGKMALEMMKKDMTLENYMVVCKKFLTETELITRLGLKRVQQLLTDLKRIDIIGASMNQLGKSVFCFCTESKVPSVLGILSQYSDLMITKVLEVEQNGPQIREF